MHPFQRSYFENLWAREAGLMERVVQEEEVIGGRTWWLRRLMGTQSADILDVGCGDGALMVRLKETGHHVEGFDAIAPAVALAKARGLHAEVADAEGRFPYPDGAFDWVIAGFVLEHLEDVSGFLRECRRVLRPSGRIALGFPNSGFFLVPFGLVFHQEWATHSSAFSSGAHLRLLTLPRVRAWLREAGFAMESVAAPRMVWADQPSGARWLKRLVRLGMTVMVRWLGRVIPSRFGDHLLVVARVTAV